MHFTGGRNVAVKVDSLRTFCPRVRRLPKFLYTAEAPVYCRYRYMTQSLTICIGEERLKLMFVRSLLCTVLLVIHNMQSWATEMET